MRIDFAPMEGVTGYVYRNLHRAHFGGVDRYFSPFLSPGANRTFTPREERDIAPENNRGICMIPQILTNNAADFLWAAEELFERGYGEVNLNLGCPSGTVTAKGKGSGFLRQRAELDTFFQEVFEQMNPKIALSVKTRVGYVNTQELEALLDVFGKYPIKELIVHPRIRADFYREPVRWEAYERTVAHCTLPLCYNGDIFKESDYEQLQEHFPGKGSEAVMLGRGLVANPALAEAITGETRIFSRERLQAFHAELWEAYREAVGGEKNALFKMKELWFYLGALFPGEEKLLKKVKKAKSGAEYEAAVAQLFYEGDFDPKAAYCG